MRRRFSGQVALEFMVLATAIFMIFGYILYQAQLKYISFERLADEKRLEAMGYELAAAIETVCEPATPDTALVKVPAAPYTRVHATSKVRNVQLLREGMWPVRIADLTVNDRVIIENHDNFPDPDTETACEVGAGGTWNGADGICELAQRACLVAGGTWSGDPLACNLAEVRCGAVSGTWNPDETCTMTEYMCGITRGVWDGGTFTCDIARIACAAAGGVYTAGDCDLRPAGCGNAGGVWNEAPAGCDPTPIACRAAGGAWHDASDSCGVRLVSEDGWCSSDYGDGAATCGLQGEYLVPDEGDALCSFFSGLDQDACEGIGGEWVDGDEPSCDISSPCAVAGGVIVELEGEEAVCNIPARAKVGEQCSDGDTALVRERAGRFRPYAAPEGWNLCVFFTDIGTEDACDAIIGAEGSWDVGTFTCDVSDLCTDNGGEMVAGAGCHMASRNFTRALCERDDGGWISDYDRIYLPKDPGLAALLTVGDCQDVGGVWDEDVLTCGLDSDTVTFTRPGVHRFRIAGDPVVVPDDILEVFVDTHEVEVHPLMIDPVTVTIPLGGVIIFRNPDVVTASLVSEELGCSNGVDTAESLCDLNGEWNDPDDEQGVPIDFCTLSDVASSEECEVGPGSCTFIEASCKTLGGKWEELLGCVLTATTCNDAAGTWSSFTDSCYFVLTTCESAGGTWVHGGSYHWHNELGCIDNLRVTEDLCVIEANENVMWGPKVSLDLDPDETAEVAFPRLGTFLFHLANDDTVTLAVTTILRQVMLGAEQLNTPQSLRHATFTNKDNQALTVVSDDGTCKTPTDVVTGDRSLWACTDNGVWQDDPLPPRCVYASLNSERLCTKADGFWDSDANAGAGACYILTRLSSESCDGDTDVWTARFKRKINPSDAKGVQFPQTEWGTASEFEFYIGEEIFKTLELDVGQDSLVEVRREQGFKRFTIYNPLAASVVPVTFTARTEPFDLVFKGIGTLGVSCRTLPETSGQAGEGMVVVDKVTGGAT